MASRFSLCAVIAVLAFAACGGGSRTTRSSGSSASITIAGSTALLPLVKQAAADYQQTHANVKISVSGGGSRVGIAQASQRGVDIGNSDIPAPNDPALVDHRIAVVTFAVVANPRAGVKALSTQQIRSVFTGRVTDWKQVGGADQRISVINRPRSSGTRAVLVEKILGGSQPIESGLTQDSSGTVATIVAQTPGAVSYLATGYVKPGEHVAIAIDGVSPAPANVETEKYPYWSYEHMLTNGQPSAAIANFINYVRTDTALLRRLHFIPLAAMKSR